MRILLALISLVWTSWVHAQVLTTATPYDLTSTLGSPISLPIRFDLAGRVSFKFAGTDATVFPLMTHAAWEFKRYSFYPAVLGVRNEWVEAGPSDRKLYVKRHRVEGGVGIGLATKFLTGNLGIAVGLVPFKGATWESRAFKKPQGGWFSLPLDPEAWDEWELGEGRDYQAFGGLTFSLGASVMGLNLAQVFTTAQSRWHLVLEKVSDIHLRIRIRQDRFKKIGRVYGPFVANWERAALTYFDRERSYLLDMSDPESFSALLELWKGRLDKLQASSATDAEEGIRRWEGSYQARYLGIPYVFGQASARVSLDSWEVAGVGRSLSILNMQTVNKGVLRESDPQVWTVIHDPSEATIFFLAISQSMERGSRGVRDRLGRWMEQMAILMDWPVLKDKDFLDARLMFAVKLSDWEEWLSLEPSQAEYQMVCATQNLKCRRDRLARKAIRRFAEIKNEPAEKRTMAMAEFLIRHPILWRQLIARAGDKLTAEFMAHGERFMPLQKILTTP